MHDTSLVSSHSQCFLIRAQYIRYGLMIEPKNAYLDELYVSLS